MSPRADCKVHLLAALAWAWGGAGRGLASVAAGNKPDAPGASANATDTAAATALCMTETAPRDFLRVNLRIFEIFRFIDTPPRLRLRLTFYSRIPWDRL